MNEVNEVLIRLFRLLNPWLAFFEAPPVNADPLIGPQPTAEGRFIPPLGGDYYNHSREDVDDA